MTTTHVNEGGATAAPSKVERLGHPAGSKLLILHADDLGMAHSQNGATVAALERRAASSASLMVTAPWAAEAMAWYRLHPEADIGVHLTLTSEWHTLRWGGVLSPFEAPSLRDEQGYFPKTVAEVAQRADAGEAERELRAQLAWARELGLQPTHLDTHMGAVMASPEIFQAYLRLSRENGVPAAVPPDMFGDTPGIAPGLASLVEPDEILVDRYVMAPDTLTPGDWPAFYTEVLRGLRPGTITQVVVHFAYDDAEMRAASAGYDIYDAPWRQRDFDFFTSAEAREVLASEDVVLTTWRELGKLLGGPS